MSDDGLNMYGSD